MQRLFGLFLAVLVTMSTAVAQPGDPGEALVSSWTLIAVEKDPDTDGAMRVQGPRGLLVIDRAGHVFEFFSTNPRTEPESPLADPLRGLQHFGGFWGRYRVDESGDVLHFDAESGVSPSVRGARFSRDFEVDGDLLVVTSGDEPHAQARTRWTWRRVPTVEHLTPAYREVMGFWQHVVERQVNTGTGEIRNERMRAPSLIVYTPGGFVGVHFPSVGREPPASASLSEEDAQAALRGYIGYFGALGVYPGEVSHNVLSGVSPGTGSILRRYAAIDGDELVVTLQGGTASNDDDEPRFVTEVVLRRLSNAADMLPALP